MQSRFFCEQPASPERFHAPLFLFLLLLFALALSGATTARAQNIIAITNVTVIDGSGAAPQRNMTVLLEDGLISGMDLALDIPANAERIDGSNRYLLPGFIDANVHASIYGNSNRRETVVKYGERNEELALEFAQRQLKHGVTTVRDSYGALEPLIRVRDRINQGEAIGARLLVAGNIVGWGGPFSMTFSLMQESELTAFQAAWNDHIAQGVGEELMDMGPDEVRAAINNYLDKGPNFLKYGGTSHFFRPSLIGFSPRVQKAIVEETHRRGLVAETHATSSEALRIAVEAGIDLIQHPEILSRKYPEDLIRLIVERDVICGLRSNTLAGEPWRRHQERRSRVAKELENARPPRSSAERREREQRQNLDYEIQRDNAERLINAGCRVSIATDNYQGRAPEFRKVPKPEIHEAGIGSILAIEGLVELGMSEMDALVAATRNGAMAAGMLAQIGTVEVGKIADLLLLSADPLADIANIRKLETVFARGKPVNVDTLPQRVLFYTGPMPTAAVRAPSVVQTNTAIQEQAPTQETAFGATAGDLGENPHRAPAPLASAAPAPYRTEASTQRKTSGIQPIRRVSKTARGKFLVELENGELWRQLDSDNTPIALPSETGDLTAEFKRSFTGSTMIKISGTYRAFKASLLRTDNNRP